MIFRDDIKIEEELAAECSSSDSVPAADPDLDTMAEPEGRAAGAYRYLQNFQLRLGVSRHVFGSHILWKFGKEEGPF